MTLESTTAGDIQAFIEEENDFAHEEEVSRNPYYLKAWLTYIGAKQNAPAKIRNVLYERALKHLPGSYKLWRAYLLDRMDQVKHKCPTSPVYQVVNNTFDRAMVTMHRMPRLWLDYLEFLTGQKLFTHTRRAFDRALQSLPITQHERIWPLYVKFIEGCNVWQTAVRVYRRLLQFDNSYRERYVAYLLQLEQYDEAAVQIATMVNDDSFVSRERKSKHGLWMQLCEVISKHPRDIKSLQVEPIIRSGLRRFTDEVGRLWCALADYYIRLGQFEKARDIYEEGMTTVITVRDFSTIFDACAQFEETLLQAKIEMQMDENLNATEELVEPDFSVDQLEKLSAQGDDTELRLERLELLMDRRKILLSSVLLRQNPHNVHEWHKRASIFEEQGKPEEVIACYTEAVKTVQPEKAIGKPHTLWTAFARYYERHNDMESARVIFSRATDAPFRHVDSLASIYCEWAETEIRHNEYQKAREVMQKAVRVPRTIGDGRSDTSKSSVSARVHKSTKVWGLFLDLEESLGTVESTKAAYEQVIQLNVVTPQMILNYAQFLEEHKYFEDSFRAYEKGIAVFVYPHVKEIWIAYLHKFMARYAGKKLERLRDLFEQAVDKAPADHCKQLYLLYAEAEEKYGMIRHAMSIYDRAVNAVNPNTAMYEVYLKWLEKAEEYYGLTATRDIYEQAVEKLPDKQVVDMCMRFMAMEKKLGEIDRARGILMHASQFCDPRKNSTFWSAWHDFEIEHGNEETYRDMLRTKRTVEMQFSQVNYTAADMLVDVPNISSDADAEASRAAAMANFKPSAGLIGKRTGGADAMKSLEDQAAKIAQHTGAEGSEQTEENSADVAEQAAAAEDANAIDIDDEGDIGIEQQPIPDSVFGSAAQIAKEKSTSGRVRY